MLCGTSQLPTVASMSLVLLSTLWLIVQAQAIAIKPTPELQPYEVVRPKKLHILHKREIQNNQTEKHGKEERYEPELQYQMILNGEEVILRLQKAKHLLGPDYTETYYSPRGEKITTSPQNMEHCYYKGHVLNEKDSVASICTCDGLRGYFTHHNQRHMIKPLKITDQEEHAVLIYNQEELDPANHTCGVRNVGRKQGLIRTSRSLKRPEKDFLQAEKYIDLFLVLDNAFYNMYNRNITLIRSFVFDVINLLNVIYNTIDIQVVLIGMEIWSDGDKIKVVPNTGVTFNNFLNWHRSNLGKMKIHDHAQLLSGVGFRNRITGLAASNSLCSPSSVAVIEGKRKNSVSLVGVMAHELGHVLGMPDVPYNTNCPSGSCVMNEYLSSKFPKDFSTVSRSHFKKYILSQKPRCLLQTLVPKNMMIKPVCGNQLLEVGEVCDCGSPEECANPCCEAMTCMLKPEADCGKNSKP
ncbi:ADAM DEC1 [Eschrichtius robustus]|uniref:ADAM DEC1 n=1 Tax=Eschrichtius robustus TaxID=9764 RepID=UPI0035C25445